MTIAPRPRVLVILRRFKRDFAKASPSGSTLATIVVIVAIIRQETPIIRIAFNISSGL
jgi:hypothetical protein